MKLVWRWWAAVAASPLLGFTAGLLCAQAVLGASYLPDRGIVSGFLGLLLLGLSLSHACYLNRGRE